MIHDYFTMSRLLYPKHVEKKKLRNTEKSIRSVFIFRRV